MLKKKIQYRNFEGELVEDIFYFNVNKAELAELELRTVGGLRAHLQKALDNVKTEPGLLIDAMKLLIKTSYGVRSIDGKKFYKTDEYYLDFQATEAYSELFFALCTNAEAGSEFVNGILGSTVGDLNQHIEKRGGVKELTLPSDGFDIQPLPDSVVMPPALTPDQIRDALLAKTAPKDEPRPKWLVNERAPTRQELVEMPAEHFVKYAEQLRKYL